MSSIDVLVAGLRKQSDNWDNLPEEEKLTSKALSGKLISCLSLGISHAAMLSTRASAACMQVRRKAALDACTQNTISEPVKEWLMVQPLNQSPASLFGKAIPALQKELSVDMSELRKGMAMLAKPVQQPNTSASRGRQTPPKKRQYSQAFENQPNNYRPNRGRGNSRGRPSRRGRQQFPPSNSGGPRGDQRRS